MTPPERPQEDRPGAVGAEEFRALFHEVRTWGRWGARGGRGALNHLTPERVAAAARLVRSGVSVSLGRPVDTERGPDNPQPADHRMTMLTDVDIGSGSLRFAKDYIGVDYHSDTHSHLDALSHVAYEGRLYDGHPDAEITSDGAGFGGVDVLADGLVGRGVLLDVPRVRGVRWLGPGESVVRADLEAAERAQGVRVGPGDILLVRTGHALRLEELGPWDTANAKPGLHPETARFLAERCVSALGSDGNNDTAPSETEGVAFPMHALAITAMGIHLLDYLRFEDLVGRCEREGRWAFLFVAAPLRIPRATGSPLNPVAIL